MTIRDAYNLVIAARWAVEGDDYDACNPTTNAAVVEAYDALTTALAALRRAELAEGGSTRTAAEDLKAILADMPES